MNTTLATNNISVIPDMFFNMFVSGYQSIKETYEREIILDELKRDIGDDLFYSLSNEDKQFILDTEGSVHFGYELTENDIKRIEKSLREDYEY